MDKLSAQPLCNITSIFDCLLWRFDRSREPSCSMGFRASGLSFRQPERAFISLLAVPLVFMYINFPSAVLTEVLPKLPMTNDTSSPTVFDIFIKSVNALSIYAKTQVTQTLGLVSPEIAPIIPTAAAGLKLKMQNRYSKRAKQVKPDGKKKAPDFTGG